MNYKTSDLPLAAYLAAKEHKLIDVESDARDTKRKYFVFDESAEELHDAIMAFSNKTGIVEALTYSESLKNMKNLVHNL